jgi:methyl-accepting chemotaxis protein
MAQAVAELLVNAVEALPDAGGRVGLRAWESEGFLRIEVSDDGRGIPESEQAYVLDPFYTTKPVGIGMGLTRAARIVQEHGGTLTLASDPGHGARVEMILPLNPDGLPL